MAEGCIFCAIADRTATAEVVEADANCVAFLDINPATRGHTLIIPRRHSADLHEIAAEDLQNVMAMAQEIAGRMPQRLGATGVNLLNSWGEAAWQTVFHFHVHVIPRYDDDPLKLPWIPTHTHAEDLAKVAEELR
ncbi:MAG: HIT domain-containing protein [Actinobacteria bacterium]|nr:HIT domain-containing protein [Actinomycetota bacterium]